MANNPPPFIPPDLRVSPSGPYIGGPELGGAIVRMGCDVVIGSGEEVPLIELGRGTSIVPRVQGTPDVPLQVTFLEWESTDLLWVAWHMCGVIIVEPGESIPDGVQLNAQPIVDLGAGPMLIDPSGIGGFWPLPLGEGDNISGPVTLAGHACIPLTNPAQPPIVQLAIGIGAEGDNAITFQVLGGPLGVTSPSSSSCWLLALELDAARVFQTPPEVTLTPLMLAP